MRSSCIFLSEMLPYKSKSHFVSSMMLQLRIPLSSLILGIREESSRAAWTWLIMVHSM